ncbi:MAG: META domain-containing protein, partial [Anaerolineae bacterium]|nr:META domain-containing protein [Anaerolineae bacterium]NIN94214.1 META domain-containing protein [Anaerolineae bacterium]NIQ77266.1 META domain-containing protein [Anaerolineae bacterium]
MKRIPPSIPLLVAVLVLVGCTTVIVLLGLVAGGIWMVPFVASPQGSELEPTNVTVNRHRPADLDGTDWVLRSLYGSSLVEGSNITLNFGDGFASGFSGCNAYGGEYTAADDGTLTIPEIAVTAQLCQTPEGVMRQEDAYIQALGNAAAYRLTDDRLEIHNVLGETTLVLALKEHFPMDPRDLVGTEWQLRSLNGSHPVEGSEITIAFTEDKFSGSAGCRGYRGTYRASGDNILFPELEMTESGCRGAEALVLQEGEYTTSLEWATNYRISEGQLEIFTARGEVLLYGPVQKEAHTSPAAVTISPTSGPSG